LTFFADVFNIIRGEVRGISCKRMNAK